ncbi:M15 family metallopeptidase [Sutcliffiella deserti]|uniref:M15 family metallopeptidase n=1 Tax=Sutcliffiella deserti TaxID=2875501 RepID=UPI001CBE1665|nr:M15 family metallopeptidase [Sutcliffiella deserti]
MKTKMIMMMMKKKLVANKGLPPSRESEVLQNISARLFDCFLVATYCYRSFETQQAIYQNFVDQYGEEAANRFSAKPGESEHQTGLTMDVTSESVDFALVEEFGSTKEGEWIAAHAAEFGFVLSYPEGKEDITGYIYEPWHYRYVGEEHAKFMKENDLVLKEYLNEY